MPNLAGLFYAEVRLFNFFCFFLLSLLAGFLLFSIYFGGGFLFDVSICIYIYIVSRNNNIINNNNNNNNNNILCIGLLLQVTILDTNNLFIIKK